MLEFSSVQMRRAQAEAERDFRRRAVEHLCEEVPSYLPFFPAAIRARITSNLIARGRALGFEWESNLVLLADMMLSIAPNMAQDRDVGPVLRAARDEDLSVQLAAIGPDVWERLPLTRSDVPAWIAPETDAAEGWAPAMEALSVILWEVPAQAREPLAIEAAHALKILGAAASVDGLCACAGWIHFYGATLASAKAQPWVQDLLDPAFTPEARIAGIRARVMLDHARRV